MEPIEFRRRNRIPKVELTTPKNKAKNDQSAFDKRLKEEIEKQRGKNKNRPKPDYDTFTRRKIRVL